MKRNPNIVSIFAAAMCMLVVAGGCEDPVLQHEREMQVRQDALQQMNEQQAQEIKDFQSREKQLKEQLDTLKKIGDKRPDEFVKVTRIRISSFTGGVDRDKKPGQEAVKIMFSPEDAAGDPVKSAGDVKIEIFDLAAEKPADKLLATYNYTPKEALKFWAGGMLTNHYSFTYPLPEKFKGGELTIRAEFTDYVTGKKFSDQKTCKIQK